MSRTSRILFLITLVTFLGFFVIEALLWTMPWVQNLLLPQLNPGLAYPAAVQGQILRSLFVNQGVYNLLLALGGCAALMAERRGDLRLATMAVGYFSLVAIGAAVTLLMSTHAYGLAVLQALFPMMALVSLRRDQQRPGHRRGSQG